MSVFDLLLIASVLLSLVTLVVAAGFAVTGRFRVAGWILRLWGSYAIAYFTVVLVVSLFTRPRELVLGEDVCFDDWCIAVERIDRAPVASTPGYLMAFRLSSRARRVSQRERYLAVYLMDERGQRYEPRLQQGDTPFDVVLSPGQVRRTSRAFAAPPANLRRHLVITHEGGFPIGWFIFGQGPFAKGIQLPIR